MLKVELVHLVLCLECQNLILSLNAEVVALHCKTAALLDLLYKSSDLRVVALVNRVCNGLLLTRCINLLLKCLVSGSKLVELNIHFV